MQSKEPIVLYIKKSDYDDYTRLKEKDSPLNKKSNKELFFLAMSFGYHFGSREEISSDNRRDFLRMEYLNDRDKAIIKALAIVSDSQLDVLLDNKRIYTIAEEYATSGLKILKDMVFSGGYGSFSKKLEVELIEKHDNISS